MLHDNSHFPREHFFKNKWKKFSLMPQNPLSKDQRRNSDRITQEKRNDILSKHRLSKTSSEKYYEYIPPMEKLMTKSFMTNQNFIFTQRPKNEWILATNEYRNKNKMLFFPRNEANSIPSPKNKNYQTERKRKNVSMWNILCVV